MKLLRIPKRDFLIQQSNLRKMIIRIDNIRNLSFIQSAYAIVETLGFFVVVGLLILKVEPFYESVFFTMLVSFLVVYMIFLSRTLIIRSIILNTENPAPKSRLSRYMT